VDALRSKSWEAFAGPGSPPIDIVLTVCDKAASETCPVWPGQPVGAHWGAEDPASFAGPDEDARERFEAVARLLQRRIERLIALPLFSMDAPAVRNALDAIGESQ
jgi:arsenate reductase